MNPISELARCPALSEMPLKAIAELSRCCVRRQLDAGDSLFRPGDAADRFWLLLAGGLQLADRSRKIVGTLGPRDFLGETTVLLPTEHRLSAVAVQPTTLLSFSKADVDGLWERIPPVAALLEMSLASWISKDLREANDALLAACPGDPENIRHDGLRRALTVPRHLRLDD